jgi:predicted ester cyclase
MKNENEEIVKQYIETVLNAGNDEDLSLFISPQYTEVVNNRKYRLGIEGIRKKIARTREIYPDLKLSIDLQVAEGNWVVTSYHMKATQLGNWMGLQSIGKPVEVWGVDMDKIVDGKIVEHISSTNFLDPLIGTYQHPMHLIKNHLQRVLAAEKEDTKTVCETESA